MEEQSAKQQRTGGFTDVAKELSTPEKPVSRQLVYAWARRAARNGFPARVRVGSLWLWDLDEVAEWYRTYEPGHGGRPRVRPTEDVIDSL